jgi:hypothetical protein
MGDHCRNSGPLGDLGKPPGRLNVELASLANAILAYQKKPLQDDGHGGIPTHATHHHQLNWNVMERNFKIGGAK